MTVSQSINVNKELSLGKRTASASLVFTQPCPTNVITLQKSTYSIVATCCSSVTCTCRLLHTSTAFTHNLQR